MSADKEAIQRMIAFAECAKLIGSIIGGLTEIAGLEAIHRAVRWWANHEDPWEALRLTLAPDRLVDKS